MAQKVDLSNDIAKVVFLHIPKTAGSSISSYLSKNIETEILHPPQSPLEEINSHNVKRIFCGHYPYNYIIDKISGNTSILTFLREPKERILSYYYFLRSLSLEYALQHEPLAVRAQNMSRLDFFKGPDRHDPLVKNFRMSCDNSIIRYIAGIDKFVEGESREFTERGKILERAVENISRFSFVGFFDSLSDDLPIFFRHFGLEYDGGLPTINVRAKPTNSKALRGIIEVPEPLTQEENGILSELTELDKELYKYAKSIRDYRSH